MGTGNWIAWSLASAVFAAATALLAKGGVSSGMGGVDSNLATAIRTTVVVLFTWGIATATGSTKAIGAIGPRAWWLLVFSGLATGLSWLCYFRALQVGPVSRVAPVDKLSVVLVILLAWPVFGERITGLKLLGGALIAAGAAVLALA